jgi:transcriptional regulator with XRE-family HTH domain
MTAAITPLFCALLKYWRGRRGMSQLELALASDVSNRHLSFLETGRARPSRDMVLRLGAVLDLPLRDQNALLDAAGFTPAFPEPSFLEGLSDAVALTLRRMQEQHDPYPLVVVNRCYDVLAANRGATMLLGVAAEAKLNLYRLLFDPQLGRPFVVDWERVARSLLSRLHRESLARPGDEKLAALVRELFEYPGVPRGWRQPEFADLAEPVVPLQIMRDGMTLSFLTAITAFAAPQNVTLDEIRIESYFPLDERTSVACARLFRERSA